MRPPSRKYASTKATPARVKAARSAAAKAGAARSNATKPEALKPKRLNVKPVATKRTKTGSVPQADLAALDIVRANEPAPPLIAIVGRPNVGKSTLFNRLTGKRTALVSDMPGLTRDRRKERTSLAGHKLELVDTAGLEEAAPGSIPARMRAQSEAAINAADLILFVIDARAGVTGADKQFAEVVRKSGRPAILVANKCEGRRGMDGAYDSFSLGLGDPVPISAEHGEGLADLTVDVLAALGLEERSVKRPRRGKSGDSDRDANPLAEADAAAAQALADAAAHPTLRPVRVAIVGRPNAGKSTLVNALLGDDRMITGPEPGLTRDSIASDHVWEGRSIRLFDTAGLRRKSKVNELAEKLSTSDAIRAIRFAEVVVLVVDAEHPFEHQDLTIGDLAATEGRAVVIAVNKWDLVTDKQARLKDLRETVSEKLSQMPNVPVIAISALGERGLDKLMLAVFQVYETWNKRVATPKLNRWLSEALERHSPPAQAGRRIKIRYMTQASTRPPTFVAFCSHPEALPKAYERYLINSLRATFGMPGVPIRLNMRKADNPYAKRWER